MLLCEVMTKLEAEHFISSLVPTGRAASGSESRSRCLHVQSLLVRGYGHFLTLEVLKGSSTKAKVPSPRLLLSIPSSCRL